MASRSSFSSISRLYSTMSSQMARRRPWNNPLNSLYRRISAAGDPNISIVSLLDQWIEQGRTVDRDGLMTMIKELRFYRRYGHALEISMWMTDKRYYELSSGHMAIRLDLIAKVHGIEQAESFFDNIPIKLRALEVYSSLLNCYANVKDLEKAEATMQKMRDMGLVNSTLLYNVMLNLYSRSENYEKIETLMHEMEEKGISFDRFTICIWLNSYVATSNIEGIDMVLRKLESNFDFHSNWSVLSVAANGYTRAGLFDKAWAVLKKAEESIGSAKKDTAYNYLLTQYAAIGKKEEVMRLWNTYNRDRKVYNRGYMSMMTSLLKFDDIENAEKIFKDWESKGLTYDIRIPNYLMGAYCRKGLLDKAETLYTWVIMDGGKPDANTWYYLATLYLKNSLPAKAVEYMKNAISSISVRGPQRLKRMKDELIACLEYLKREGDVMGAEELIRLLKSKNAVSQDAYDILLTWLKDSEPSLPSIREWEDQDSLNEPEETSELCQA